MITHEEAKQILFSDGGTSRMEFVFNRDKAVAAGYSLEDCYAVVDELFARYGIYPICQGVYEAPDNQNSFDAFGVVHWLPHTDWFLKVIETWCFYDVDNPLEREDCLSTFYQIKDRNCKNTQGEKFI